ncbi:DUF3021 domain-containing protein [Arthrobacter gengyunqii]|uniref:DUF3021 domain-containing protein n=1 Tax=Arthrobacter gengyunqii TaxID=2886940 RepID=A0A9X1M2S2_9MICC|nr:DUF3021 domain-containing protein [Arthrobacter gengyunqii]MCC3270156.1 DUF3021 domain-containing protein [Arthrobacter gengyunqii]UOY96861.1 DUF3021 domain-containing protein [Arthrobacter gengyunqii]
MKLWGQAVLRGGIPLVIMSGISVALYAQGEAKDGRGTLFAALVFGVVLAASVIYDVERWTLARQTVVHFAVMIVTVLPLLFVSGWFPTRTAVDCFAIVGTFLLVGLVLWTAAFVVFGVLVPRFQARSTRDRVPH